MVIAEIDADEAAWVEKYLGSRNLSTLSKIVGSASDRCFYRASAESESVILCVASTPGDVPRQLEATRLFTQHGFPTPTIMATYRRLIVFEDAGLDTLASLHPTCLSRDAVHDAIAGALRLWSVPLRRAPDLQRWSRRRIHQRITAGISVTPQVTRALDDILRYVDGMPFAFAHNDFHARNLVTSTVGNLSMVDIQDCGWSPYIWDLSLFGVDPNYAAPVMSVGELVRTLTNGAGPLRQRISARDLRRDVVTGRALQLCRLVMTCTRLWREGRGERFRNEARWSADKLINLVREEADASQLELLSRELSRIAPIGAVARDR